jgi:hypothetical protein
MRSPEPRPAERPAWREGSPWQEASPAGEDTATRETHPPPKDLGRELQTAALLVARLERLPADSHWAHQASGVRGALLRCLEGGAKPVRACRACWRTASPSWRRPPASWPRPDDGDF